MDPWSPTERTTKSDQTGRIPKADSQADMRVRRVILFLFHAPTQLLCFPAQNHSFPMFPVPQNCLRTPVSTFFRP